MPVVHAECMNDAEWYVYFLLQVEKAEAILLEIRKAIDNESGDDVIRSKSDMFFEVIQHKPEYEEPILTKKVIARKQDICQVSSNRQTDTQTDKQTIRQVLWGHTAKTLTWDY